MIMTNFTPWTLFVDLGIISILMLIGKLMRVKIKIVQKLFIPPSLLAGFMGLALGPNGFDLIPLSTQTGTYAGIMIAFIFGSLPLTSQKIKAKGSAIGSMWAYSKAGLLLQWAFGGLLGLLVLNKLWPLNPAFGITMPGGFCGGHGTATALGQAFGQLGSDEILTLAITAATFGIVAAIVLGLVIIKWGTGKKYASFLVNYNDLPDELRTGLLPEEKRESIGKSMFSSISIDSLTFNFVTVAFIALGGYCISKIVSHFMPGFELPVFSCAFVFGLLIKKIFDRTKVNGYICPQTVEHISGAFTDLLVAFGIASIKISVVVEYIVPFSILLFSGLIATFIYVIVMARKLMKENWFEKAIFTWGWFTGTMAMGIALLRIVDPQMKSRTLDSYALAYLFVAPVEILLITFAPAAFHNGYGLLFSLICLLAGIGVLLTAYLKGWYIKNKK
ncbi:MAG: sodium:glutamate symporter [Dysgonamonadaceae bacterium]|jgi:ESS family glutamate:Na+ symporter|nr:sodium:glutamate symporter [Dysgonamonadaceae bacterium]